MPDYTLVQVENFLFLGHPSPLTGFADPMYVAGPDHQEVVVVLAPECVGFLKAAGMSKMQVKEELFELTRREVSDWIRARALPPGGSSEELDRLVGVTPGPDNITVLVAGGAAGVLGSVVPHWAGGYGSQSVTKLIRSPAVYGEKQIAP